MIQTAGQGTACMQMTALFEKGSKVARNQLKGRRQLKAKAADSRLIHSPTSFVTPVDETEKQESAYWATSNAVLPTEATFTNLGTAIVQLDIRMLILYKRRNNQDKQRNCTSISSWATIFLLLISFLIDLLSFDHDPYNYCYRICGSQAQEVCQCSIVCDNCKCIQQFLGTGAWSLYATHIIIIM